MPVNSALEAALRRDRLIVAACLIAVSLLAWAWLLAGAGMDMTALEMTHPPESGMNMDMVMPSKWTAGDAVLMFFMWWIMMIAMMLPSATPVILLAAALNRRADTASPPYGSTAAFTLGYLSAWALFSLVAVAVHWLLEQAGLMTMLMESASDTLSGLLLIAAGLWQLTPFKQACLRHCRSPVEFLTQHRRPGNTGSLVMGAHHGVYCLGCCWFLMALLFVGGVMNLYWIIGLALFVYLEKVIVSGRKLGTVLGVMLIIWGVILIV
jgi:predicted metal-binding membrane protein